MKNKKNPQNLDYLDHAAELEILLPKKEKILVLEGNSDCDFYRIITNEASEKIHIYCLNSDDCKNEIIKLFDEMPSLQSNNLILAIVDKDLDEHIGIKYGWSNLLQTDFPDTETYYINFSGFRNFVREVLPSEKINDLIGNENPLNIEKLRMLLHDAVANLTILRVINHKYEFCIPLGKVFKKSPECERKDRYKSFKKIIKERYTIDKDMMFNYIRSHSKYDNDKLNDVIKIFNQYELKDYHLKSNGHDLISILSCISQDGKSKKNDVQIEESLRIAVAAHMFSEFSCTQKVMDWVLNTEKQSRQEVAAGFGET